MPPESDSVDYFETPARAERLQLLLHLIRNTEQVIYLRAPAGAGKTLFVQRLLGMLGGDIATVWIQATADADIVQDTFDQLGIAEEELLIWPDAALNAAAASDLLLVVDDADLLGPVAAEQLAQLQIRGGRVLLVGHGGLTRVAGDWAVQFVDLPEFDLAETADFLRALSGDPSAITADDMIAALHRAAQGLPGPLLEGHREVLARAQTHRPAVPEVRPQPRVPRWLWMGGGVVVSLLLAVLVFQDPINALFEAGEPNLAESASVGSSGPASDGARLESTLPPGQAPAMPVPDLPALPPQIDLPELTRPGAEAPAALSPLPTDADRQVDMTPTEATRTAPQAVRDDLLDSMLQDALVAAESLPSGAQAPISAATPTPRPADRDAASLQGDQPTAPLDSVAPELPAPAPSPGEGQPDRVAQQPEQAASSETPPAVGPADPELESAAIATGQVPPVPPTAVASAAPAASRASSGSTRPAPAPQAQSAPAPAPQTTPVTEAVAPPGAKLDKLDEAGAPALPGPAPVEERSTPTSPKPLATARAAAQTAAQPKLPEARTGLDWLRARAPGRFTLQLVGARDRAAVEKFIRVHRVPAPHAVFERELEGRPWHSLVAGDYPDRAAAMAARSRLPPSLSGSGVWPRTFESIQKYL